MDVRKLQGHKKSYRVVELKVQRLLFVAASSSESCSVLVEIIIEGTKHFVRWYR